MGNVTTSKINFENVQEATKTTSIMLINTLSRESQDCLIRGTIPADKEESLINHCLKKNKQVTIFVYGKNNNDETIVKKHKQFVDLGFKNVYVYPGGLFEWLLMQDIYGEDNFPTTSKQLDLLRYKPSSNLSSSLVVYR
tara:strand:- start:439 stop:855 length:417 start_codon:yes stop_codon:yes gene_type:complete